MVVKGITAALQSRSAVAVMPASVLTAKAKISRSSAEDGSVKIQISALIAAMIMIRSSNAPTARDISARSVQSQQSVLGGNAKRYVATIVCMVILAVKWIILRSQLHARNASVQAVRSAVGLNIR